MMQFESKFMALTMILTALSLCSCTETRPVQEEGPQAGEFNFDSLVKTDIGVVMEVHVFQARNHLRSMMEKLYKRNPRELKKSKFRTAEENIERLFEDRHGWNFEELDGKQGIDAIRLTFSDDFKGDRVFAFISGMTFMIMSSYGYKTEFYLLDTVDPQNLYNSARNIEIAVWKLSHDYDQFGELFLYSNSRSGEIENLSYERLFGHLITLQDTMAIIIAGKTSRTFIKIVQRVATAVFLPVF